MSPPSVPPPAYVQASSSRHGHSDEDIPLPPYESHLFANYEAGRKNPQAHAAEVPNNSSPQVEAQRQAPNAIANALGVDAAENAGAARRRQTNQMVYNLTTVMMLANGVVFLIWFFAHGPDASEDEAQK